MVKKDPYLPRTPKSVEWGTPSVIFEPLDAEFHFNLDAAASPENAKCDAYWTEAEDGSAQSWRGYDPVFINPPYDVKSLEKFVAKALYEQKNNGITSVLVLPVKTDQHWFHMLWGEFQRDPGAIEFRWVKGRVKYEGAKDSAPYPTVIVVVHGGGKK